MRSRSITELRKDLPALLKSPEKITVTRHGKPVAVVVSHTEFEALMVAWELAKDPLVLQQILAEHEDFMRGGRNTEPGAGAAVEELTRRVARLERLQATAGDVSRTQRVAADEPKS